MRTLSYTIAEDEAGKTFRSLLSGRLHLSVRELDRLKRLFRIRLNGEVVRVNRIVEAGDVITADLEEDHTQVIKYDPVPLDIVYEDEDFMIIDKPAPLPSQITPKDDEHTLANRVAWYFRDRENFIFRVVNRLDKGTSGLMAVAKNAYMNNLLREQLHTPDFVRRYLAVVEGVMEGSGTIDAPIRRVQGPTIRREISPEGKRSVTHYSVIEHGTETSLVRFELETGRTHQIRVHMQSAGHPLIGDFLYGREDDRIPGRLALHASEIILRHPATGEIMHFESGLPEELKRLIR